MRPERLDRLTAEGHRSGATARGFTLIELLVVVAIIALLISILTPALAAAKQQGYAVFCQANLRQMQTAWEAQMQAGDGLIPYTRHTQYHPNWADVLNEAIPNTRSIYGTNEVSFNACPSVQTSYYPMFYAPVPMWGYAVNRLWSWDGVREEPNEGKRWAGVATPHRYPWFVDPQVFAWGSGFNAAHVVPYSPAYKPDWGVGANHGGGTTANASYADGHVASVPLGVIHKLDDAGAHRAWFVN